jgi:hypothetical protein
VVDRRQSVAAAAEPCSAGIDALVEGEAAIFTDGSQAGPAVCVGEHPPALREGLTAAAGATLAGVEIVVEPGATIQGRLLGAPADSKNLRVVAARRDRGTDRRPGASAADAGSVATLVSKLRTIVKPDADGSYCADSRRRLSRLGDAARPASSAAPCAASASRRSRASSSCLSRSRSARRRAGVPIEQFWRAADRRAMPADRRRQAAAARTAASAIDLRPKDKQTLVTVGSSVSRLEKQGTAGRNGRPRHAAARPAGGRRAGDCGRRLSRSPTRVACGPRAAAAATARSSPRWPPSTPAAADRPAAGPTTRAASCSTYSKAASRSSR